MTNNFNDIITEEISAVDKILNPDGTINFHSFEIKDSLNPDIFVDEKIKPEVKKTLLKILDDIIEDSVLLKRKDIRDAVIVGSIVSYHYSSYSDIDFHIIIDMDKWDMDSGLVKAFLDDERKLWNINHHIEINGYDVELYFQDKNEKNVSNGCYSVLNDEWVKFPDKEHYVLDKEGLSRKALNMIENIEALKQEENPDIEYAKKLWDKIVKGRKEDISENGEFSEGNILFKILRRTGHIEILKDIINSEKDDELSITESICVITPDIENIVRNYVRIYIIPEEEPKEMELYYNDIIGNLFGEPAIDSFDSEENDILSAIIDDEYIKNGGKTTLDGIPIYEKNKEKQLSKLNTKINSAKNMKLNMKAFNNTLMESVKDYCAKNNKKEISRNTFMRLVECALGEDDKCDEDEEISENEKDLAVIHLTARGKTRNECGKDAYAKLMDYLHDMKIEKPKVIAMKYKDVSKGDGVLTVELEAQIAGITGDDIYLDEKDDLKECINKTLKECNKAKSEELTESDLDDTKSSVTNKRDFDTLKDIASLVNNYTTKANSVFKEIPGAHNAKADYNRFDLDNNGELIPSRTAFTMEIDMKTPELFAHFYFPVNSEYDDNIFCKISSKLDKPSVKYTYISNLIDKASNRLSPSLFEEIYKSLISDEENEDIKANLDRGKDIIMTLYKYELYKRNK